MEEFTKFRTYAEIDLNKIRNNLKECMSLMPDGTKPVGVIKADAYGHGAVKVAEAINDLVDAFAVATVDEALELRNAGFITPIYILGYSHPSSYRELIDNDIIPAIFKEEDANAFSKEAVNAGKTGKINIKIDTGMGRIGFRYDKDPAKAVENISKLPNVEIYGTFMHFATADQTDKTYADVQFRRFNAFLAECVDRGINFKNITCANSAAVLEMPYTAKTEMRVGISLYGYSPSDEIVPTVKLERALTWKSHIVFIKEIEDGESISYGRTYIAKGKRKIATIPVGYADGYPRSLSEKGKIRIGDRFAPVAGRVCMDMFMADVTDIPDVKEGDEVILLGDGFDADDIAKICGTISYEITCGISGRVPRLYV